MGQMKPKQTGWGESSSLLSTLLGLCVPERGHQTLLVLCDRKTNQNDRHFHRDFAYALSVFAVLGTPSKSVSMTGAKTRMCIGDGYFLEWGQMIKKSLFIHSYKCWQISLLFFFLLTLCSDIWKMLCIIPKVIYSAWGFCPFLFDRHWKRCFFFPIWVSLETVVCADCHW